MQNGAPGKPEGASGAEGPGRSAAARFWRKNLDPQNLEREGAGSRIGLEAEIAFAATPDVEAAIEWLAGGPASAARIVLDLGAGLGAVSLLFARRGWRVIAMDSSVERLRELRRRAEESGCGDKIWTVAGAAEALPFGAGALPAVVTKSVLIHVDLESAAAEIARALAPGGRAALDEPQPGNPFAWLYRRTLAPKEWQGITRYFRDEERGIFLKSIGEGGTRHFYLFSFLAFAFQFGWPWLKVFRAMLGVLNAADRPILRRVPWLRRSAWFGLALGEKAGEGTKRT